MGPDSLPFAHKNIRLEHPRYVGQCSYFITMCCQDRRPVFTDPSYATWLIDEILKYSLAHDFAIHAYCVMPDHFHVFVSGLTERSNLLKFLKTFKQMTGHRYHQQCGDILWQKKFYDHILRETDNISAVAGYIWMNPVRAGLCTDPRDYPYSGSFTTDWKNAMRPLDSWIPAWKKKPNAPE